MMMQLACPFCGEVTRKRPADQENLKAITGLYLTHLIESHWDTLEKLRAWRLEQGPVNDAWKRL